MVNAVLRCQPARRRADCAARLGFLMASVMLIPGLPAAEPPDRPNILFIYADDHSPKTLSCYEHAYPLAHTPHIDALAATGVRFQGAYLGSWCMPSRASLLTGLHPHSIQSMRMEGQYPGSTYDSEQCRFWPAVFRQHGYQTAQIGKWHTGTDTGWARDWDFQIVWNRPKHPDNAGSYYGPQVIDFHGEERTIEGYSTDNYTDWACDYIRGEQRDPDKPWFLWLCYGAIHGPTIPAERHVGTYAGRTAEPPASMFPPRAGKPAYLANTQAWSRGDSGEPVLSRGRKSYSQWLQQVNECMLAVDEGVGRVMDALRASGQLANTFVIYSSDQGFANGEHGLRQKVAPYEASYRSPLIVSRPGTVPEGNYFPHAVNAPDLVVTFFALAGIELPWRMHGRDVTPLLQDPARADWHPTLFEHTGQDYGDNVARALAGDKAAVHSGVPYYAAVRHGRYKYVRYLAGNEPEELYDVVADAEELTNLAANPESRDLLSQLRGMLAEELRRCDAGFDGVSASEWRELPLVENGRIAPEWTHLWGGGFTVQGDGAVRTACTDAGMGLLLYTKERFGNCQIRVVYRCQDERSNAGVYVRIDEEVLQRRNDPLPLRVRDANGKLTRDSVDRLRESSESEREAWYPVHHGYEVQICDTADEYHRTGAIYSLAPAAPAKKQPQGAWRTMVITLQEQRIFVDIDGERVSAFAPDSPDLPERTNWTEPKREAPRPISGYLGLQNHDPGDVVDFKEVSVRPLHVESNTDQRSNP